MKGYHYVGRLDCVTGYGAAARHQLHVLRQGGLRLNAIVGSSAASCDPQKEVPWIQKCLERDKAVPDFGGDDFGGTIIHMSPNIAAPRQATTPGPHVLVSVWETTKLPAEWVELINTGWAQVWCATRWQRNIYEASGVREELLRVVPFAFDPALYSKEGPVKRPYPAGVCIFGSIFQWTARKAPEKLLAAFLEAFQHGEKVALVLKTYEGDDPSDASVESRAVEVLRRYRLNRPAPPIHIVTQRLTHLETLMLMRGLDCLVAASRGEGWGLPLTEARLLDIPVIASDWGAHVEYAPRSYLPVGGELVAPCDMDWQPFYSIDQQWFEPGVADLVERMREVYEAYSAGRGLGLEPLPDQREQAVAAARAALEEFD